MRTSQLLPTLAAVCLSILVLPPSPAEGASGPDPRAQGLSGTERVHALLERVREEQAEIVALKADFVQRRESELLLEPEESRGRFAFLRPDRVLWEYRSPVPMRVLVSDDEMTTWYEALDKVEILEVGRYSDRILEYLGATNSLDLLQKYFDVTVSFPDDVRDPYRLELSPRSRRVEKRLAGMTLWLDPELFVPRRIRYLEADGDVTEYEFHDIEVNPPIPASHFELHLPPGVEMRRVTLGDRRGE